MYSMRPLKSQLNSRSYFKFSAVLLGVTIFYTDRCFAIETTTDGSNEVICGNLSCALNSKCEVDHEGTKWCDCHEGFDGPTCHADRDECSISTPCLHRGDCHNTPGSFRCQCYSGWEGHRCQHADINEPSVCELGWGGPRCMNDVVECLNSTLFSCGINQSCLNSIGSYTCVCNTGWQGLNCTQDIDECLLSNPCNNGGICSNTDGSYTCICERGWHGQDCSNDVNECFNSPCANQANCSNSFGAYSCSCTLGWQGINCTEDVDECLNTPCENNGTCIDLHGSFSCSCDVGWTGTLCSVDVDECLLNPCKNGGTCINTFGSFFCMCTPQYWGDSICSILSSFVTPVGTMLPSSSQLNVTPTPVTTVGTSLPSSSQLNVSPTPVNPVGTSISSSTQLNDSPTPNGHHSYPTNIALIIGPVVGGLLIMAGFVGTLFLAKRIRMKRTHVHGDTNEVTVIQVQQQARTSHSSGHDEQSPDKPRMSRPAVRPPPELTIDSKLSLRRWI